MNDRQLLQYSGHIMLPQLGYNGQQRLLASSVLLIGVGGLGSAVAMYLAAAGVGHLLLADFDQVELSNLQRQILHGEKALGHPKAKSAASVLREMRPECKVSPILDRMEGEALVELASAVDLVVDASDNFATRFSVNAACVHTHTPLVSGAAIRWEGQITAFGNQSKEGPCYRCLYSDAGAEEDLACSESGVLGPLVGVIGSLQAVEAIKLLTGCGEPLLGRVLIADLYRMEWRSLRLKRDPNCIECGSAKNNNGTQK